MPKTKGLTLKQRKFVRELKRTFSPTEAAFRVYNCKDRLVARNIAHQNLAKLGISMQELMDKMGLDTQQDLDDLKRLRIAQKPIVINNEVITTDDYSTQVKALELTLKLKGHLQSGTNINVDQSKKTINNFVVFRNPQSVAEEIISNADTNTDRDTDGDSDSVDENKLELSAR